MGLYDLKSTRVERKLTSEQIWTSETPGSLNGQETMDKVGSDNSLAASCIKNVFLHLCLLVVVLVIYQLIYQELRWKSFEILPEIVGLFPPILFQIGYPSYEWPNNCQTP